ncbi:MAG TPA: hypothetical protein VFI47_00725 [Acidimicrobiales bacterium]|nr:hypothetical protein [Acidimicrobiales bacterium]
MREDEDDAQGTSAADTSLADGMGETAGSDDEFSSSTEPFGDDLPDETYGDSDDESPDGGFGDSYDDESTSGDGGYSDTYGDGDSSTTADTEPDDTGVFDTDDTDDTDGTLPTDDDAAVDPLDMEAHDASPLEGIGYLLDQVRDALLGEDDAASPASPFDAEPEDVASDSDLDLTGDGVVDRADLHEAGQIFDFRVEDGHHG